MQTSSFWQAVDRLGTGGVSLTLWRKELNGDLDAVLPFLRRMPGVADRIPDPDEPRRPWMRVSPTENEEVYVAESEDSPAHRAPFDVPARDLSLMAPDWEAIRPVLAGLLGFNASTTTAPHSPSIRQIGFSQPQIGTTTPVFLHLPTGSFTDHHTFLTGMHSLPECVLYVPTNRHLRPEVFTVANSRKIAIESITDRLTQTAPASTTLTVAATLAAQTGRGEKRSKEPLAILAVQPGWAWEKLHIKLTEKGTLVAQYGTARGEHSFGRTQGADGKPKYPLPFKTLFQMCVAGRWQNPPRTDKTYTATQRNFARLRELMQKLVRIDGDPFRKVGGGWEPRFQFEPDRELAAMLDYQARKNSNRRVPTSRRLQPHQDDAEDVGSE